LLQGVPQDYSVFLAFLAYKLRGRGSKQGRTTAGKIAEAAPRLRSLIVVARSETSETNRAIVFCSILEDAAPLSSGVGRKRIELARTSTG
jgi:hypothetical protein